MSPTKQILSNFKKLFGGQLAVMGISFITLAINTRALGAEGFGILVTIEAACQLAAMIGAFQTWQAITRFGAEAIEKRDRDSWIKFVRLGTVIDIAAAFLAGAAALLYFLFIHSVNISDSEYLFGAYFFTVTVFTGGTGTAIGTLRVTDALGIGVVIDVCRALALLFAAILLDFFERPLVTYLVVIASITAFANVATLLMGIGRGWQQAGRLTEVTGNNVYNRNGFLKFALATSMVSTMNAFRQRGELLLVSWFLGSQAAGLYSVAYRSAAILARLAEAGRQSVYSEFAKLITSGKCRQARGIALKATHSAFLISLPIFLGAVFFGDHWLTFLAGDEFAKGHANLVWLCIGTLAYTLTFALGPYVQIAFGAGQFLKLVSVAFGVFVAGAVMGPIILGMAGAGFGAGVFGVALVGLLYRQIFALRPEELDTIIAGRPSSGHIGPAR